MTDHPILFSAPMVRAILSGSKTQTRRVLKPQPVMRGDNDCVITYERGKHTFSGPPDFLIRDILPTYGLRWRLGDRLWVREGFAVHLNSKPVIHQKGDGHPWGSPIYRATFGATLDPRCEGFSPWRSPIHMPRWASRIKLAVEAVRVERLQDISEGDAIAEGVTPAERTCAYAAQGVHRVAFCDLWNTIHGADAWNANPWVSVTTFRRVEA